MEREIAKYPYQEFDLEDLKGEIWEDIPFLDGLYRVSNLGRIKRLDIEIVNCRGNIIRFPSKILRAFLGKVKNKGVNDYIYHLSIAIKREGKNYKLSVARLVYYCFVKEFAIDDTLLVILPKDGNGKNIKPSNLLLANIHQKQKRIFDRGRYINETETIYDEYIKERKIKSKKSSSKQVSQYSLLGKKIETFPGIRVAAKICRVSERGIISVLKKRQVSHGGYVWEYGRKKDIDVTAIRKANKQHYREVKGKKVTQYDLKGNKIASYFAIMEASKKTGVNESDIHAVLKGTQRSAGGFIWREGFGKSYINVENFLTGEAWRAFRRQKKVNQYSKEGKLIGTFPGVKVAAQHVGIGDTSISIAIKNKTTSKGYFWKFADEKK